MSSITLTEGNLKTMPYFHDGSESSAKIKRDKSDECWRALASTGECNINKNS